MSPHAGHGDLRRICLETKLRMIVLTRTITSHAGTGASEALLKAPVVEGSEKLSVPWTLGDAQQRQYEITSASSAGRLERACTAGSYSIAKHVLHCRQQASLERLPHNPTVGSPGQLTYPPDRKSTRLNSSHDQ